MLNEEQFPTMKPMSEEELERAEEEAEADEEA